MSRSPGEGGWPAGAGRPGDRPEGWAFEERQAEAVLGIRCCCRGKNQPRPRSRHRQPQPQPGPRKPAGTCPGPGSQPLHYTVSHYFTHSLSSLVSPGGLRYLFYSILSLRQPHRVAGAGLELTMSLCRPGWPQAHLLGFGACATTPSLYLLFRCFFS